MFAMLWSLYWGSLATPIPTLVSSPASSAHPKSLKLHASLSDFPLASKIIVKNLSYSTSENRLQKEFSNFGLIAEVKLVKDDATKISKGYAFIQYTSQENAMLALECMDNKYFDGRVVFVELAKLGNNFGGYPKTSGPPKMHKLLTKDDVVV